MLCIFWELSHYKGSVCSEIPIRNVEKTPLPLIQRRKWNWNPFPRSFSEFVLSRHFSERFLHAREHSLTRSAVRSSNGSYGCSNAVYFNSSFVSCPAGSLKYCTTRKNIQPFYTLKRLMNIYFRKYSNITVRPSVWYIEAFAFVAQRLLKLQYQPPNGQWIRFSAIWRSVTPMNCKRVSEIFHNIAKMSTLFLY